MNRDRLNRIRTEYEKALTRRGHHAQPTTAEIDALVDGLGDALAEITNTRRHQP